MQLQSVVSLHDELQRSLDLVRIELRVQVPGQAIFILKILSFLQLEVLSVPALQLHHFLNATY